MQQTDFGNEDGGGGKDDDIDYDGDEKKETYEDKENKDDEEDDDDDITRLDETEDPSDHSHLDDAVLPKMVQTILDYLEKRPSSSLGTIAVMCKLSEFTAARELSKMATQGLVKKMGRSDRWCMVGKPKVRMEETPENTLEETEATQTQIKPESKKRQVRDNSDTNLNNDDLGGTSLSQESSSSQSFKYSIVERPIKQFKKYRSKR